MKHSFLTLLICITLFVTGCQDPGSTPKESQRVLKSLSGYSFWMFFRGQSSTNLYSSKTNDPTSYWTYPQQFNNGLASGRVPSVLHWDGWFYAAYKGGSTNNIYLSYSQDGSYWYPPSSAISGASTTGSPGIVVWNNELYIFFIGDGGQNLWYVKSPDFGSTWTSAVKIATNPVLVTSGVTAIVDPATNALTVFYEDINENHLKVKQATTTNGNGNPDFGTLGTGVTVTDCNNSGLYGGQYNRGVGATVHNGAVYIAYPDSNGYIQIRIFGGCQSYTVKSSIVASLGVRTQEKIALTSVNGRLVLAYKGYDSYTIYSHYSDDNGANWSSFITAPAGTASGVALVGG
jgi:hypothetical protein